jgi:hypothetical protein
MTDAPRCADRTLGGAPCPKRPVRGFDRCWSHLPPDVRVQLTVTKKPPLDALAEELTQAEDAGAIRAVLTKVAALVLAGRIPVNVGQVVAQLANAALRALADDLSKELEEVKSALADHEDTRVQGWARRPRRKQR